MGRRAGGIVVGVAMVALAACGGPEAERAMQDSAASHYDIAVGALADNNLNKAISELQIAVQEDPQNARGYHALGTAYLMNRQPDLAIAAFRRALELNPRLADSYYNLGLAYMQQQMWDPAIDALQKVLLYPQFLNPERVYVYLGNIYYTRKQYDLAEQNFLKAIDVGPRSPDGYFLFGRTLLAQGKLAEAQEQLERAIQIDGSIPAFHFELGLALMRAGKRAEAKQSFRRLLELSPAGGEADEARRYLRELN